MMRSVSRFYSIAPLLGLSALLAGCAAQECPLPSRPVVQDITATDLRDAARAAYRHGFEAGIQYQRKRENAKPATGQATAPDDGMAPPAAATPLPAQPQPPAGAAPQQQPPTQPQPPADAQQPAQPRQAAPVPQPPPPLPPLPPSSNYTTSGPAQPLSQ